MVLSILSFAESAKIIVNAPVGTEVKISSNNQTIKQFNMTSNSKRFSVDDLEAGTVYYYDFSFNGSAKQRISFKAGETYHVDYSAPAPLRSRESKQSLLKVYVPNRRTILIINGIKMEDQEGELREFRTPFINENESKRYTVKIEYTDDTTNRKVERQKEITVRGGETYVLRLEDFITELKD
jgi:uncharacterized protein (TIGR03000 family)